MANVLEAVPLVDIESSEDTAPVTPRMAKTRSPLKIVLTATLGALAVAGVYYLSQSAVRGSTGASMGATTNLAEADPAHDAIRASMAGLQDGSILDVMTEDATIMPPGSPPIPAKAAAGMMGLVAKAFPHWHSKVWNIKKNADGTYAVQTQQIFGPMVADLGKVGPFPAVAKSSVPAYVVAGKLRFPVEVGTWTMTEDGTKIKKFAFGTGAVTQVPAATVSPQAAALWHKDGDLSNCGFGAFYGLLIPGFKMPAPPAESDPAHDVIRASMAGLQDGSILDVMTEDATIQPPGSPPLPAKMAVGVMGNAAKSFPHWKSKVWNIKKNADGTYAVQTQQIFGPMVADLGKAGPFPAVAKSSVPAWIVEGKMRFPVEEGTWTMTEDGTKIKKFAFGTGAVTQVPAATVSPQAAAIWDKDGDLSKCGFGAFYGLLIPGFKMPAPPAK